MGFNSFLGWALYPSLLDLKWKKLVDFLDFTSNLRRDGDVPVSESFLSILS